MFICCILFIVVISFVYLDVVVLLYYVILLNLFLRVLILDIGGGDIWVWNFIGEVKVRGVFLVVCNCILSFSIGYFGEVFFDRGVFGL